MIADFSGAAVLVTGGGQGFGRAIALAFAARGAAVWTCDLLADGLAETLRMHRGSGSLTTRILDVTEERIPFDLVAEIEMAVPQGRVDVLVNNAGGVGGQVGRALEEVEPAAWRALFAVNVDAAFRFCQAVTPGMKRARSGRIINISSGAGLGVSLTGIQAYASAKAAQIGMTRQLAHELGPWGITVNSVAPGFVRSNPTTERQWQAYGPEKQQALVEGIALKRLGSPDDIAHVVLFFASSYAGWISGQVLSVDGGR